MPELSDFLDSTVDTSIKVEYLEEMGKKEALKMLAKILAVKVLESVSSFFQGLLLSNAPADIKNQFQEEIGVALADPYIYPMRSNIPVKLPDIEQDYRLYQNNDTFINAEVSIADNNHKKRMIDFVKQLGHNTENIIDDGYFFSKFFIADGKNKLLIDLREKSVSLLEGSNKKFFNLRETTSNKGSKDWNGKAHNIIVEWRTKENIKMKSTISFFENPHIENGISVSVNKLPEKALGLCVKNYRPKLMRLPKLNTEHYKKIATRVKKSRNPYQKLSIISKREGWFIKNNKIKATM